jgi:hypothetical protein
VSAPNVLAALASLRAAWPDAGWQVSYMGDDVLIGIVQGAPIACWPVDGRWRANMHHGASAGLAVADTAVVAVRTWVDTATRIERMLQAERARPRLPEDPSV